MKTCEARILLLGILLAVVLLWLHPLLGHPWIFSAHEDIDINSGDIRHQVYVCSFRVKDGIEESAFSREVRRLGIAIPTPPVWKRVQTRFLVSSICVDYTYGPAIGACNSLLAVLTESNASDQDRRIILQKFLATLQNATARTIMEGLHESLENIKKGRATQTIILPLFWTSG
jgi:hypothetical protein